MPNKLSYYLKNEKPTLALAILFGILFNVAEVFDAIMLGKLIDSVNDNKSFEAIIYAVIFYTLTIIGINILRFFKRYFIRILSHKIEARMRVIMYNYLISLDIEVFERENMGDLMSRLIGDINITTNGIRKGITEIFDTGVRYIVFIFMMSLYDPKLTLFVLFFVPLVIAVALLLRKKIEKASADARCYNSFINGNTYDLIDNSLLLRRYGTLSKEIDEYYNNLDTLKNKEFKANLYENSLEPIYLLLTYFGLGFVIYLCAKNVVDGKNTFLYGVWSVGAFSTYIKFTLEIFRKTSRTSILINMVEKAKNSFLRIKPYLIILEDNETIRDLKKGNLEVSNLVLYKGEEVLLKDISFNAKLGDIIGVTGKIGSGKSLLGLSLTSLYKYDGSIKLNNIEISTLNHKEKAKLISYMGHKPYLMSDTIENNILFGKKEDISDLLDTVSFTYDLKKMPDNVNTTIGNHGTRLSGGQGQRLSLARALYDNKNLIILDDPFSASDIKTEEEIIKKIKKEYKDSIIILISHRLTMFPYTTNVLMLDSNKSYFMPHEKMIEQNQKYRDIYYAQRGDNND